MSAAPQTAYGPFTLASTTLENPLPVELLSLEADYRNEIVEVQWVTASEINSDYFLVQRSANGKDFEIIGNVKAAGNSTSHRNYIFTDKNPLPGITYYRLNQIDFDGSMNITNSVAVKAPLIWNSLLINNLFANYNTQTIYLNLVSSETGGATIEFFDMTGRSISKNKIDLKQGENIFDLPYVAFSKGIYTVRIFTGTKIISQKFNY